LSDSSPFPFKLDINALVLGLCKLLAGFTPEKLAKLVPLFLFVKFIVFLAGYTDPPYSENYDWYILSMINLMRNSLDNINE
jgi:hypothetical protein